MNSPLAAQTKRPGAIVAMVVLQVINALFGLITATFLLSSGAPDVLVVGIFITTFCVLSLIFAVGLWMLRRWARLMALAVSIPFLLLAIFGHVASGARDPGTYLTVVACLVTLAVLFQPRIKQLFT
jgi:uncharacterized membrane protein (DUF2068 family)